MKKSIIIILHTFSVITFACGQDLINPEKLKGDIDFFVQKAYEIHPNLYGNIDSVGFTKTVDSLKTAISNPLNDWDFFKMIAPLSAKIADGHTGIYPKDEFFNFKKTPFAFFVSLSNKKLYVLENFSDKSEISLGSEIMVINDIHSIQILNAMKSFLPSETALRKEDIINKMFPMLYNMIYSSHDSYKIEILNNGNLETYNIDVVNAPNSINPNKVESSFKKIYKNVGLFDLRNFDDDNFINLIDSVFIEISENQIEHLIIDLRNNGGGKEYFADSLLNYLTTKEYRQFQTKSFKVSKATERLHNDYKKQKIGFTKNKFHIVPQQLKSPVAKKNKFQGSLYILTSPYTYSTAASFVAAIKCYDLGTIIGQETGQTEICYGNVYGFILPNSGLPCTVSKDCYTLSCGKSKSHGIQPDYLITMTINDKIMKVDKELEFTLELIGSENN